MLNAEHTLTLMDNCPYDTVCFHAQQCAEKYLKSLLVYHGIDFPKTHDLVLLRNLLPASAPDVNLAWLRTLNRYSVEARYPGDWEPITNEEGKVAVQMAKEIKKASIGYLQSKL